MTRLPQPGKDAGTWGDILNDFLAQSHNTDGSLKNDVVGSAQLQDNAVTETILSGAVQTKLNQTAPVTKVNNQTGDVTITKTDVGLNNVDNTADTAKPISTVQQAALDLKADTTALAAKLNTADLDTQTAAKITTDGTATQVALSSTYGTELSTPETPARTATEMHRVSPSIFPITELLHYFRIVVAQALPNVWALYSRAGETPTFQTSSDGGFTWTELSTMPASIDKVYRLKSGTFLAIEPSNLSVAGGSNPAVYRSTDGGATWAAVTTGLQVGPLTAQGFCEGTDGSVMIGEYTNSNTPTCHVIRSTDDGATWAPVFSLLNHHIHSITWDPYAEKHVLFADDTTSAVPEIHESSDNGATWTKIGDVTSVDHPNYVAPMYFENYIAWGADNGMNGRISRIHRADFYAGNFDACEQIAQLSQRAAYATFPVRPDVWAISFNGEHINSTAQTNDGGTTACDVWLVSEDGLVVSGGLESYYRTTQPGSLSGVRPSFPSRAYDDFDTSGFFWVNMPTGIPRPYAAVPVTQGWGPQSHRLDHSAKTVVLSQYLPLRVAKSDNPADGYISLITPQSTLVEMTNDKASASIRGSLQFQDGGDLAFRSGTTTAGWLRVVSSVGTFIFNKRIDMAQNAVGIRTDSGISPEGVVTAPLGTIYQSWGGQPCLWYKFNGTGNTGWRPIGNLGGEDTAANFALASASINTVGKYEGRPAYDTTNDRPVWASGAGATATWKYADGTVAFTPA